MKNFCFFSFLFICFTVPLQAAQIKIDTVKVVSVKDSSKKKTFTTIEKAPEYPGGVTEFYRYISRELKYPEVAKLIGIDGKVYVSFVIEKDGRIVDVKPVKCVGAGCDAEAVKVIEQSKPWIPGVQDNRPVSVQYTVPINFNIKKNDDIVSMKDLRRSDYGFFFEIKGNIYDTDQAEAVLGKKFTAAQIAEATPYESNDKYQVPGKKQTYIIVMK